MSIIYYILFFLITYGLLMGFFRFTTHHQYFVKMLIPLLGYGVLTGFLLFKFNLISFFIWHLGLCFIFLTNNYFTQKKSILLINSITDELVKKQAELSIERTLKYYILSAISYLLSFSLGFLYFYNN